MPDISIILPAKRVVLWKNFYNSIERSFNGSWELIIITSEELPMELKDKPNIRLIHSERSPLQKQQLGLVESCGKYILSISDDHLLLHDSLNKAYDLIKKENYKTLIVMKYYEGHEFLYPDWHVQARPPYKTNYEFMRSREYYLCHTHQSSKLPYIPEDAPILSCALINRELLIELGGWDCRFNGQAIANADLAARLMRYGCHWILMEDVFSECGHMPGMTGDHGPLHYAQVEEDEPLLKSIYSSPDSLERVRVSLHSYRDMPNTWKWRERKLPNAA